MDEYVAVLCRRLQLVRFISGESSLKVDSIHRITAVLGNRACVDLSVIPKICELMRVFIIDWDRTVRSSAFRLLRYCIIHHSSIIDDELVKLSIHRFTLIRLEACKTSTERAAVLRFVAEWIRHSSNITTVGILLESMIELLIAAGGSPQGTSLGGFVGVLFDTICEGVHRFPQHCSVIFKRHLDQIISVPDENHKSKLIELCIFISRNLGVLLIPKTIISVEAFKETLGSSNLLAKSKLGMEVPEVPKPPQQVIDSDELSSVVQKIDSLASSVHFKQKSASLLAKKQKNPSVFHSVALWVTVMQRLSIGRFSLQARRVVHSLFIHTFSDEESLETLDSLISVS